MDERKKCRCVFNDHVGVVVVVVGWGGVAFPNKSVTM